MEDLINNYKIFSTTIQYDKFYIQKTPLFNLYKISFSTMRLH